LSELQFLVTFGDVVTLQRRDTTAGGQTRHQTGKLSYASCL